MTVADVFGRLLIPDFFRDLAIARLSLRQRLLALGLPMIADREGRIEDFPDRITAELFPGEVYDVAPDLDALVAVGLVNRYIANGRRYLWLPYFAIYQRPHKRERASRLPQPPPRSDVGAPLHNLGSEPTPPRPAVFDFDVDVDVVSISDVDVDVDVGVGRDAALAKATATAGNKFPGDEQRQPQQRTAVRQEQHKPNGNGRSNGKTGPVNAADATDATLASAERMAAADSPESKARNVAGVERALAALRGDA